MRINTQMRINMPMKRQKAMNRKNKNVQVSYKFKYRGMEKFVKPSAKFNFIRRAYNLQI